MHIHTYIYSKAIVLVRLSRARLFATPWTAAHQAPLSRRFSRQRYWSGLLFPSPGELPKPGIKPMSPALQADYLLTELQGKPINNAMFSIRNAPISDNQCFPTICT